jgi:general secretion pathway protein L
MRLFLSWWFSQLAGLLPGFMTHATVRSVDAIILDVGVGTTTLLIRVQGAVTRIMQAAGNELGLRDLARALQERKSLPALLLLRVPPEWVLKKRVSFPAAARRNLKTLLGFEIDRETPFARDEIYWNHGPTGREAGQGRIDLELRIIPKRCVEPLLDAARRAGLEPSAVEIEAGEGRASLVSLRDEISPVEPRFKWPLIPRAVALCVCMLAAMAPFAYQEWAIVSTDALLASIKAQADEAIALRRSLERLTRAADFFNKDKCCESGLAMLAAVTQALPDDSYLTALQLHGDRLMMSGLSPSAAHLVGLFAHSPLFKDPSFDSPVVGTRDGDLERFTISVSLAQAAKS